ncbi:IS200/IS605 family accessory protein TnpB-related protein [Symbiobacterium terraclitae]|uniref:IS200/IS605 family accessory protein TnpB-related protein n=1 Tax=Symbiobacterium terraclitae TaxID=557451 RepID=UPI004042808C
MDSEPGSSDQPPDRELVLALGVGTIRMEDLSGIRFRRKRGHKDQGRSLHSWAFYQLQRFVEYKARLAGIKVEYVVAENTSRRWSGLRHHRQGQPERNQVPLQALRPQWPRRRRGRCEHRLCNQRSGAGGVSRL